MKVFYHPGYAAPLGNHLMPIRKFGLVADALRDHPQAEIIAPDPVTETDLLRVHTADYIDAIKTGEPRSLAESQKFPWSPQLFESVCLTSGGCLAAARAALKEGVASALVSGFHHASADHGEGFCTFNGLVVTIDALIASGEIKSAAVLDLDLHYGNGTALLARTRPYLFALSIYGNDYVENVCYREVTPCRHEDGENHRSFALPAGTGREYLLESIRQAWPLLAKRKPDLLLYQAGADPFQKDPFSPLTLNHEDLRQRDLAVFQLAKQSGIPIAWVLAGGYTEDVSEVVRVHLNTFEAATDVYENSNAEFSEPDI